MVYTVQGLSPAALIIMHVVTTDSLPIRENCGGEAEGEYRVDVHLRRSHLQGGVVTPPPPPPAGSVGADRWPSPYPHADPFLAPAVIQRQCR